MQVLQNKKHIDVLIVSPNHEKEQKLAVLVQAGGYSFASVRSIEDFLSLISLGHEFAIAIIDQKVAFDHKFEFVRRIKKKLPTLQPIVITTQSRIDIAMRASNEGVFWLLQEQFESEELLYLIARGIVVHQLAKENQILREAIAAPLTTDKLVAQSETMRKVIERIQKIAVLDSAVLLTGESGTGKTLLASILHKCSARAEGPFTAISCANLPRDLLESELFGTEKGAFTGASVSRPGAIELCNGGTLFLDEIGELPLDLQPKLLTFLQDKMVRRLGGRSAKQVNVRIVCATNRNLEEAVRSGQFREDLYYRVNVLQVRVPPLRERRADIPILSQRLLLNIAKQRGRSEAWKLSRNALDFLANYHWPGNVRELEHALERASAFSESSELQASDFEIGIGLKSIAEQATLVGSTLKQVEARLIRETLKHCSNSKEKAAKMLGVSLKTIYNRLRMLEAEGL